MSSVVIEAERQPHAGSGRTWLEFDVHQSSLPDERRIVDLLTAEFAVVVVTQKFAIPLGGADNQIALALIIHCVVLAWLMAGGRAKLDVVRLILFSIFSAAAVLTQVGNAPGSYSLPSLGLMLITSSLLVVVVPLHRTSHVTLLKNFSIMSACASALVLLDWLTQLAGLGMPNLESVMPQDFIYQEYVYVQPLQWDSPWLKPNALFFLEASHISQFVAIGLVIELAYFKRKSLIAINAAALILTFGGTGLIIVGFAIPFLLSRIRPQALIAVAATTIFILLIADSVGLLGAFTNRTSEFTQTNSSAYNRFIMPAERFAALLQDQPGPLLTGTGAGTMPKAVNNLAQLKFGLTWPPYVKVAVEYGVITFACWLAFILYVMFGSATPFLVGWVAFVQYQFLNGSLNVPIHTIYCWLLCAGYHLIDEDHDRARPIIDRKFPLFPLVRNAGVP
jgi:hypothetical protein